MTSLEQLQMLYDTYAQQAQAAKKKSSYFASVLGSGNDHRNHPCHDQFFEAVGQVIGEFLEQQPDADAVAPVLQWLLMSAAEHKNEPTYWYLYAIHRYAQPLIQLAEPALCVQLQKRYEEAYPKIERMPVQQSIYKALSKRAKKG